MPSKKCLYAPDSFVIYQVLGIRPLFKAVLVYFLVSHPDGNINDLARTARHHLSDLFDIRWSQMDTLDNQELFIVVLPSLNNWSQLLLDNLTLFDIEFMCNLVCTCKNCGVIISCCLVSESMSYGIGRQRE